MILGVKVQSVQVNALRTGDKILHQSTNGITVCEITVTWASRQTAPNFTALLPSGDEIKLPSGEWVEKVFEAETIDPTSQTKSRPWQFWKR